MTIWRNRAGRIFVLRDKRVIWQSRRTYPRDGGSTTFGPHTLAFASYRRGIFLTDLKGPERQVARGRGLYPYDFTSAGELLVVGPGWISVISSAGKPLRHYRYSQHTGFGFDKATDTIFFGTRNGMLAAAHGSDVRLIRSLRGIDGWIGLAPRGLLVFEGAHSMFVMRRDGTFVARADWPRVGGLVSDSGLSVSPDGRAFVYRLSNVRPGSKRGRALVYVLHEGEKRARLVYGERLGPSGCGVGADFSWHGRFVMYRSSEENLAAVDISGRRVWRLTTFLRSLPGGPSSATSYAAGYWASELGQS